MIFELTRLFVLFAPFNLENLAAHTTESAENCSEPSLGQTRSNDPGNAPSLSLGAEHLAGTGRSDDPKSREFL